MEYQMKIDKKNKKPIIAICYDFDKTLSPDDMQAQGFIQSIGYEVNEFWKESNKLAVENEMDTNLAYMYLMTKNKNLTKQDLKEYGSKVGLFPGVDTWFDRINHYGNEHGVEVEHYIISSGLKEMIEGTIISDKFKKIYASSFYFDEDGVAVWPAQAVNYTNKTQFLFRIKKGVLDINDQNVNNHYEGDKKRVPFRNMIYIGDSDTDVPCMTLVNMNGGHSIGVYNAETNDKSKVFKMLEDRRIRYYSQADYQENSDLELLVKQIINRTVTNEILEHRFYNALHEKDDELKNQSDEEKYKEDLINKLEDSTSFSHTHSLIHEMSKIDSWTSSQKNKLIKVALSNTQVKFILKDKDLFAFYKNIYENVASQDAVILQKLIEDNK
ncbi:haloacid dehalogenase-like hydrolase [Helcococcus ovis]|uniref:Haloacid dehalogenase-like hydrolase n=3 Tax=Peptoniphilaceae TaxID=1570339 RepID=A0A4V3IY76_9FIRM|nr:haloacid dehalogenase-like hydrolase [Helcococcus ovis]TFF65404.1 haloacid dehalogenase-like hydrolase [Helcococcus ovis]TFF68460.1 haloacid dehalogenase-like hydrolase [Helcococcus ovis]